VDGTDSELCPTGFGIKGIELNRFCHQTVSYSVIMFDISSESVSGFRSLTQTDSQGIGTSGWTGTGADRHRKS